ncbi:MAG: hypothetical protein CMN30_33925 [Sandaracinus sp.]|nr:hypothetical protein [Sandaracinus sp.]|tara:strand:- start:51 stop:1082 length:1032 start_codon:yes stop_codon:yes gene_type:complete
MSEHPAELDRVAVVVNGNAKRVTEDLVEMLDQIVQSGDLFVSRSMEEGQEIARRIVDRGYPTVLTGGGDGTFTQMVTWITAEAKRREKDPPRFGLLKLGTGNALAWVLGAADYKGRGVVADLARVRQKGGSRQLRLLDVEGTLAPFAGFGVDALALSHFNATKDAFRKLPILKDVGTGGLAYFVAITGRTLPKVLLQPHGRVTIRNMGEPAVRLGVDGQPVGPPVEKGEILYRGPYRGVWFSTVVYWGFGARIFPFAEDREDRFNLRIVDVGSLDVAWNIRSIWRGDYRDDRLHDFLVEHMEVSFDEPVAMEIGGDAAGSHRTVQVKLAEPIEVVDYYAPPPV